MRHRGRIDNWQDERGFGFITPDGGGQRVFVHIKSFSRRGRRPSAGEAVTYLVRRARDGRFQATQVAFAHPADGVTARPDQMFALLGGWPGALVAQRWLRHKSKKASFQGGFWWTVVGNCVALGVLYLMTAG